MEESNNLHPIFAIDHMYSGGAEKVVLDLVNNWPKDCGRPVLLLASAEGGNLDKLDDTVIVQEVGVSSSPRCTLKFISKLREIFHQYPPAYVMSHMTSMNRMILRCKILGAIKVPTIVVEHNNYKKNYDRQRRMYSIIYEHIEIFTLYRYIAKYIVGVSAGVTKSFEDLFFIPTSKTTTIYNPIDIEKIRDMAALDNLENDVISSCIYENLEKPIFISVGRTYKQKNYELLIKAFGGYIENNSGTLVILGNGPEKNKLISRVDSMNLSSKILIPGHSDNPWWYMKRANMLISTSDWEGYGMVLVESLLCGTDFISTDCKWGPREIFEETGFGNLIPVGNAEELIKQMEKVNIREKIKISPDLLSNRRPLSVAKKYINLMK